MYLISQQNTFEFKILFSQTIKDKNGLKIGVLWEESYPRVIHMSLIIIIIIIIGKIELYDYMYLCSYYFSMLLFCILLLLLNWHVQINFYKNPFILVNMHKFKLY